MALRENFTTAIKCPKCNKTGTAEWSENENPMHGGGLDTRLISVSNGFINTTGNKIECSICNVAIP